MQGRDEGLEEGVVKLSEYMMRVTSQGGERILFFRCPNQEHNNEPSTNNQIKEYYSPKHAYDSGWIFTNDPKWCDPTEDIVGVCPACSAKYFKKEPTNEHGK